MSAGGGEPVQRDTIFRISSMTKPVTAVATMILAEECAVRLDEPVDRLLPELADRRVLNRPDGPLEDTTAADRPITVRDLLTFCMGIGIVFAAPGTVPLAAFLTDRIFGPLGMADTGFFVPASKRGRVATSYLTNPGTGETGVYDEPEDGQWSQPPSFPSGAAGLVSTADDYLAFAEMLRAGGACRGQRVLSRASVQAMTADQLTPQQKAVSALTPGFFDDNGWGFGVSVVTRRTGIARSAGT